MLPNPALRHGGRWAPVDRGEDIYCYSYSYSPNRHLVQCVQHCRLGLGMPCSSSHLSLYSYLPYSPVRQHRVDGDDARARAQAGREHVCEVHVVEARREGEEHLQPRAPEAATACTGGCNRVYRRLHPVLVREGRKHVDCAQRLLGCLRRDLELAESGGSRAGGSRAGGSRAGGSRAGGSRGQRPRQRVWRRLGETPERHRGAQATVVLLWGQRGAVRKHEGASSRGRPAAPLPGRRV